MSTSKLHHRFEQIELAYVAALAGAIPPA